MHKVTHSYALLLSEEPPGLSFLDLYCAMDWSGRPAAQILRADENAWNVLRPGLSSLKEPCRPHILFTTAPVCLAVQWECLHRAFSAPTDA